MSKRSLNKLIDAKANEWRARSDRNERLDHRPLVDTPIGPYSRYSPLYTTDFLSPRNVEAQRLKRWVQKHTSSDNLSVLDAGCGYGSALLDLRSLLGAKRLMGVEIDPEAATIAAKFTGASVVVGNLFDQTAIYSESDVIYCYHPLFSCKAEEELERHIWRNMRCGAILIRPYIPCLDLTDMCSIAEPVAFESLNLFRNKNGNIAQRGPTKGV